jgi:glucans biosynthesis protein
MEVDASSYPGARASSGSASPLDQHVLGGPNDRRVDSTGGDPRFDGLQLHTGAGERLWRPLVNSPTVRVNSRR